jgi:hypothetical protein
MMTQPKPVITSLSPEMALATARAWGEQAASLTKAARACLAAADFLGDAAQDLIASTDSMHTQIPEGVILLAAYRSRRQAVSR